MAFRSSIPDFELANPAYVGASVTFFTVNASGQSTGQLAQLFADPTSIQQVPNPQKLDSLGKFKTPIYIEVPVIAQVTGPNVPSHVTGVINARGTDRGNWTASTVYYATDFITDPVTGNVYEALTDYTSDATSIQNDINNGYLKVIINQATLGTAGASLAIKQPVQCATTANITLSGLQTIDGYTTLANDRVLVKYQSNPAQNGPYNALPGAWTRTLDCNASSMLIDGTCLDVLNGTLNGDKRFRCSLTEPFTLGTSPNTWVADFFPNSSIEILFGSPPGTALPTGVQGYVTVPYTCTIQSVTLLANAQGSIVVDIWRATYANFPPTHAGSICASDLPTLTAAQQMTDTTLTGWSTVLNAGDILAFNVNSISGISLLSLTLAVTRS